MMPRLPVCLLLFCVAVSPAVAADVPDFLKGRTFATDQASCGQIGDSDGLQLTSKGIFGNEFGCSFVDFKLDKDQDSGRVFNVVATASCGDDSGISRPDLINLSPYIEGGQVFVQSQNEYVISESVIAVAQNSGREIPQEPAYAWVSQTYNLCE